MKRKVIFLAIFLIFGAIALGVFLPDRNSAPPPWLPSVYRGQTKAELISLLGHHGKSFVIRSGDHPGQELVEVDPTNDWSIIFTQRTYGIEMLGGKVTQAWRSHVHRLDDVDSQIRLPDKKPAARLP